MNAKLVATLSTVALAAAAALAGCSPAEYEYAPVTTPRGVASGTVTSAELAGTSAVSYAVPASAPRGDVLVSSFGIAPRPAGSAVTAPPRSLHLALVVANRSDAAWRVDAAEQRIEVSRRTTRVIIDAVADDAKPRGVVDVPAGSTRWIDLYFPLPAESDEESELLGFDVLWTVRVGPTETATERTRFLRAPADVVAGAAPRQPEMFVPAEPPPSSLGPGPGSAPPNRRAPPRTPR